MLKTVAGVNTLKSIVLKRNLDNREVAIFANNRINFKGIDIKSRLPEITAEFNTNPNFDFTFERPKLFA